MFDTRSKLLTEYGHELALIRARDRFERYAVECPECLSRKILPANDYICTECRALERVRGTEERVFA